jgi:hypothetical protein
VLVALIIVRHGIAGYTDLESAWPYLPAEAKALAVAFTGLAGSFALASPLVTRTPIGRVL